MAFCVGAIVATFVVASGYVPIGDHARRYTIFFRPSGEGTAFLLDTQSGRIWEYGQIGTLAASENIWGLVAHIETPEQVDAFTAHKTDHTQPPRPWETDPIIKSDQK
jgi:hypothetical protein